MADDSISRLEHLQRHTKNQTNSINCLPALRDPNLPQWVEFWRSVWGVQVSDENHRVIRSPAPHAIDDPSILPDAVPSSCLVMTYPTEAKKCWKFKCEKIFIRSEYNKAEEFVLSRCAGEIAAIVIAGQPGIGKSVFLFSILLRRLRLELPTALQISSGFALLFYKGGVKEFTDLSNPATYTDLEPKDTAGRIWALVGANKEAKYPSPIFQENSPFFVIQASSPCPERHHWVRRIPHKFFHMEPWSFAEVLQVRSLIGSNTNETDLFNMHTNFGASLRSLFTFSDSTGDYERLVNSEIFRLLPADLMRLLRDPLYAEEHSHLLVTTIPSPSDHTIAERKIASPFILEKICKTVFEDRTDDIRTFYDTLRRGAEMNSAAGMFFEARVHQVLREGGVINLFPISCVEENPAVNYVYSEYTEENPKRLVLPRSTEEVVSKAQTEAPVTGIYYRPVEKNFPAFDSWLCYQPTPEDDPIHLRFQMTLAMTHSVAKKGLECMDRLVPGKAVKFLVVVTEEGIRPKMYVPKDYIDKKLGGGDPNTKFPVYHLPLTRDQIFSSLPRD